MEPGLAAAPSRRGLGSARPLQPRRGLAPACLSPGCGCPAFHLLEAGGAAGRVELIPLPPSSASIAVVWKTGERLWERQVCKQLPQLPSAQAPLLLACEKILKQ